MKTILVGIWLAGALTAAPIAKTDLYVGGEGGYHTYRIPALIVSAKGTLLAFCEGRRNGSGDSGEIDVVLRRSLDGGKTWLQLQVVANGGGDTIGNPTPVVERKTGTIFLLLTRNPGSVTEGQIVQGAAAQRTVWIMHSTDDGATWSRLEEITAQVSRPDWTWYATGRGTAYNCAAGAWWRLAITTCGMGGVTRMSSTATTAARAGASAAWRERRPTNRRWPS